MGININTKELQEILDLTPADQNVMLVGRHGIGKSEILTAYFARRGMPVVTLFLGQMSDPGDLIGLPSRSGERTSFLPPYWWPADGGAVCLFLDELNRARPEVLQTVMDLVLNRKLAGRMLPEGSRIVSAVNAGDEYQLTDLDPALVSRFNVYNFAPTPAEWLTWAESRGVDSRVVAFLQAETVWLDGNEGQMKGIDTGLEKTPDRRAWKKVSDIIAGHADVGETLKKAIAGVVGPAATSRFCGSLTGTKVLSGIEVLSAFARHKMVLSRYKLHQYAIVNESIFRHLETGDIAPADLETYAASLAAYYDLLCRRPTTEPLAHLAEVFASGQYPKAILFILDRCPKVYQGLQKFVADL